MEPLWRNKQLKTPHYQTLWWILDVAGLKTLGHGWTTHAAEDMRVHRLTLRARINRLVELGVLWRGEKQNEIRVNPEAIACYVNPEGIRIK